MRDSLARREKWLLVRGWFGPAFMNGLCLFTSMWLLHCATYFYVLQMTQTGKNIEVKSSASNMEGPHGGLSPGVHPPDTSYGSLEDPLEGWLGHISVNIHILDYVSATLPMLWFLLCVYLRDLQMWTKVLTCNAFLALAKGALGVMTVVPDSSGWQVCKDRLGPANLAFFEHNVPDPFEQGYMATFASILWMQLTGIHHSSLGTSMRYCSDMMFSGHTYFTCLYALGLIELVRRTLLANSEKKFMSKIIVGSVMAGCVLEQAVEITLVLWDRFHYTSDVAVAIMLTLLFYTNGPVVIAAKHWTAIHSPAKISPQEASHGKFTAKDGHVIRSEGDIWIPACCVPFCCISGFHHLISVEDHLDPSVDDAFVQSLAVPLLA